MGSASLDTQDNRDPLGGYGGEGWTLLWELQDSVLRSGDIWNSEEVEVARGEVREVGGSTSGLRRARDVGGKRRGRRPGRGKRDLCGPPGPP